jgi:hypothetical protein
MYVEKLKSAGGVADMVDWHKIIKLIFKIFTSYIFSHFSHFIKLSNSATVQQIQVQHVIESEFLLIVITNILYLVKK